MARPRLRDFYFNDQLDGCPVINISTKLCLDQTLLSLDNDYISQLVMTFQSIEPKHIGGWLNPYQHSLMFTWGETWHSAPHVSQYLINSEGTIFQQYSIYLTNIYMHHVRPWETLTPPTILSRIKIQRKMGCLKDRVPVVSFSWSTWVKFQWTCWVVLKVITNSMVNQPLNNDSGKKGNKNMKSIETRLNSIV